MPDEKKMANFRISSPAIVMLDRLAAHFGLQGAPLLEFLIRKVYREDIPAPTRAFFRWHENAGVTEPYGRRLSREAREMIQDLADRWRLSMADTLEYIAWYATHRHLSD